MRDRLVAARRHHPRRDEVPDPVPHQQVVLEAHEEPRLPRVSLAAGPAAKLQVDAAALVAVGADDVQPAEGDHRVALGFVPAAQPDVGAAAGHVGRDGDGVQLSGARHEACLRRVVPGVEDLARHARRLQPLRQALRLRDGERADEHGPPPGVHAPDLLDERLLLGLAVREDDVRPVDSNQRPMRGHDDRLEPVQLQQLVRGILRRPGHAAQVGIAAQIVLQRQ